MDSGNSGSLQSSSGGDEEYDSVSASAFTIPDQAPAFGDPLSAYLHPDLSWPRISDPNQIMMPTPTPTQFMPCFPGAESTAAPPLHQNQAAPRNPRKRSRASRRAPTTVLTTDTSNFRAMVQEFTGIPAPPFNSSAFPRNRLDLLGSRSTSFDAALSPPYLRRPFAQKVHPPHPFLDAPTTNNNINYQFPNTHSPNLFNTPNQNILTSLLQSNPKFQFSASPIISSKPQQIPSLHDHQMKMDQFVDQSGIHRWSSNRDGDKDDEVLNVNTMSESEVRGGEATVESWICSSE